MNYQLCADHLSGILAAGHDAGVEPEEILDSMNSEAANLGGQMWSISAGGVDMPVCYECREFFIEDDTYSLGIGVLNPEDPEDAEIMRRTNVLGFVGACHQRCRRFNDDEARESMKKLMKEQLEFELAGGFNEDMEA